MVDDSAARLAVLIDADNAQPAITESLLAEVAKYGTAQAEQFQYLPRNWLIHSAVAAIPLNVLKCSFTSP